MLRRYLTICQRLFDDRCDEWGHPSSWSAWVAVLGEFMKGRAIPEKGTSAHSQDDERFIRAIDLQLLQVWQTFRDHDKFRSKQFGTVLEQFVYSLSLFFRDTGLRRDDWTEELRGVQAVIGQFIETLTGIVSAGECLSRCCQHLTPVGGVVGSKE
ncbi:unnamed protein product [Symbiodinium necroappetens]|uniref:Uncharacterized protein n=1 Tax=Symbiodinium necroappetens TaxID=1628268 RepID=A0A813A892_9DINO|nr:unnamed protein product [Symbiodinium necroappetens]